MKKRFAVIIAALLLTGCSVPEPNVSVPDKTRSTTSATTTASSCETELAVITQHEKTTSVTTAAVSAEEPSVDLSGFNLSDYCGEFDPAQPLHYDVYGSLSAQQLDPEIMELALNELKQSDLFAEVTAKADELFTVQDGELTPTGDSFLNEGYAEYIAVSEAGEMVINPRLAHNIKMGGEGHIYVFSMPLAESLLEWSGSGTCMAGVYVSPENKAQVLAEVSGQTLSGIKILRYQDGSFYAVFGRGHTEGTAQTFIVGFTDGVPQVEYTGSVLEFPQSGTVLYESGYHITMLLVKTAEHGWCYVGSVPPAEEAAEILLADDDVISACPDIREKYAQGELSVFGGKYIAVGGGFNDVYTLENGELVPCSFKNLIGANGMDDNVEFRNINLD